MSFQFNNPIDRHHFRHSPFSQFFLLLLFCITLFGCFFSIVSSFPPEGDLAAYYPLNGNVDDKSGNGKDGSCFGATLTADLCGTPAHAYSLAPSSSVKLEFPNVIVGNDFTVAGWIKLNGLSGGSPTDFDCFRGSGFFVADLANVQRDWTVSITQQKACFVLGSPDDHLLGTTSLNDGKWHHIAARRVKGSIFQIYVDGELDAERISSNLKTLVGRSTILLGTGGTRQLDASVDQIVFYNRALTLTEIQTLANTFQCVFVKNLVPDQHISRSVEFNFAFSENTFFSNYSMVELSYDALLSDGQALPGWLALNASNRSFYGTSPDSRGTYHIKLRATANGVHFTSTLFRLYVDNYAPVYASPIANLSTTVRELLNFSFGETFIDPDGDALSYEAQLIGGEPLPDWLHLDSVGHTFFGTPGEDDCGRIDILLLVADGFGGHALATFRITVLYDTIVREGLIAYYPLGGAAALDMTGNGYNGDVHGCLSATDRSGNSDSAVYFGGVSDYIEIGDMGATPPSGTIAFWMFPESIENHRNVFSTHLFGVNNAIRFELHDEHQGYGRSAMLVIGDDTQSTGYFAPSLSVENSWYLVVVSWDIAASRLTMFVNREKVIDAHQGYWPARFTNFGMGTGYSGSDRYFKGILDDFRIYARVLSKEEVFELDDFRSIWWNGPRPPGWYHQATSEYCSSLVYDVSASSTQGDIAYSLDDVDNFVVDTEGILQNRRLLELDEEYHLGINASNGQTVLSIQISLLIQDSISPDWDEIPTNRAVDVCDSFVYQLQATDQSGCTVVTYGLDDSVHFAFDKNGQLTNNTVLDAGTYMLHLFASDGSNTIMSDIQVSVEDRKAPVWDPEPSGQVVEFGKNLIYVVNAFDCAGVTYSVDDTFHFEIGPMTGVLKNVFPLALGTYSIVVSASDGNHSISKVIGIYVNQTSSDGHIPTSVDYSTTIILVSVLSVVGIVCLLGMIMATIISVACVSSRRRQYQFYNLMKDQEGLELLLLEDDFELTDFLRTYQVNREDVELLDVIARGASASVYKARWESREVAVKVFVLHGKEALKTFEMEARLMFESDHPNVVRLFGIYVTDGRCGLLMELMEMGTLKHLLKTNSDLDWTLKWTLALDLAVGVRFLHRRDVVHRDLKPDNVLLYQKPGEGIHAKIADLGLSKKQLEDQSMTMGVGTFRYMAPEIATGSDKYEIGRIPPKPMDIYSLGMTFVALIIGREPYALEWNDLSIPCRVGAGQLHQELPEEMPVSFRELANRCREVDLDARPDAEEVVLELEKMREEVREFDEFSKQGEGEEADFQHDVGLKESNDSLSESGEGDVGSSGH